MSAPLSPERVGRITGSRIGGVLGLSPYFGWDDVMREMVRAYLGAPEERKPTWMQDWGTEHEAEAIETYERDRGVLVLRATDRQEFVAHPTIDWLGCTPDGLVGDDGMVQVKCPPPRSKYVHLRPDVEAQIRLELECTGRLWSDLVIWRPRDCNAIRVERDPSWFAEVWPELSRFHDEYEQTIADVELAEPHLAPPPPPGRNDDEWAEAAVAYRELDVIIKAIEKDKTIARDRLIALAGDVKTTRGCGVTVSRVERKGSVDRGKALEHYAPGADLEPFRGDPPPVAWQIR